MGANITHNTNVNSCDTLWHLTVEALQNTAISNLNTGREMKQLEPEGLHNRKKFLSRDSSLKLKSTIYSNNPGAQSI